jgi:VanZ family protein
MTLIFAASSLSNPGQLPGDISDKSAHVLAYSVLGFLLLRAFSKGRVAGISWRAITLTIVFATLYGASDELHQRFVPGRSPDVLDVAADALGASCAAAVSGLFKLAVTPRTKSS